MFELRYKIYHSVWAISNRINKMMDLLYSIMIRNLLGEVGHNVLFARSLILQGGGSKNIFIGDNTQFGAHSILGNWNKYGSQTFNSKIIIGSDCQFGEYNHISSINKITIGNGLLTGRFVYIGDNSHGSLSLDESETPPSKRLLKTKGEINIGRNVWIGDKVTILGGVTIGNNVIIGSGSVVTHSIPDNCIAGGGAFKDNQETLIISRNNDKTLAIVVTFHPDIHVLKKNITSFIDFVDRVIIWENSEGESTIRNKLNFSNEKIEYFGVGINKGISFALNFALEYAKKYGYDYILTMDQDSEWYSFEKYKRFVIEKNQNRLSIYGPSISTENYKEIRDSCEVVDWNITSGMMINTQLLLKIGGYNENFSVDCVDIELCLRAKTFGFNTYRCYSGYIKQRFGTIKDNRWLGKNYKTTFYNNNRTYSIIKGHIILYRMFKYKILKKETYKYIKMTLRSAFFDKTQRWKKIYSMIHAICQGIFCNKSSYLSVNLKNNVDF